MRCAKARARSTGADGREPWASDLHERCHVELKGGPAEQAADKQKEREHERLDQLPSAALPACSDPSDARRMAHGHRRLQTLNDCNRRGANRVTAPWPTR